MLKTTMTLRNAALGALVLGFACAGFVGSASATDVISNDAAKDITKAADGGATAPHGNAPGDQGSAAGGTTAAHGNAPGNEQANGNQQAHGTAAGHTVGGGIGSGGNPTGEGALLEGNCFADMAVYSKDGKYVGRGIVNTCN